MLQMILRVLLFSAFFVVTICLHVQQFIGAPLYFINRPWFYQWQAIVKGSAGLLLLALNEICAPATVLISHDHTIDGQIRQLSNGRVAYDFPDRLVLTANHQIYTDWVFFWWTAYCARHHGHLFIVLKESMRLIPVLGPGMMFFSWIFMSRRWETDHPRLQRRLSHLSKAEMGTPMWLLIFPEGTNMCAKAEAVSRRWSKKLSTSPLEFVLMPRARGLQFCLQELAATVEWVYDGTLAYDGIPPGEYGEDVHSLKGLWVDGQKAPLTHLHWRRFATKDIPIHDVEAFDKWLNQRWIEKDELMRHHREHGCFPSQNGYIKAETRVKTLLDYAQVLWCVPAAGLGLWLLQSVVSQLRNLFA